MRRTSEAAAAVVAAQASDHQPESLGPLRMRTDDERIAQSIRRIEQEDEEGDAGAGNRAHDERENGQERAAPALAFRFVRAAQFRNHSRSRIPTPGGEKELQSRFGWDPQPLPLARIRIFPKIRNNEL